MGEVTAEQAADFFRMLLPYYTKEPVIVELRARVPSCPYRACMAWDGKAKAWRILAGTGEEVKRLFHSLFHELKHLMDGQLVRVPYPDFDIRRALMDGKEVFGAELVLQQIRDSIEIPERLEHEDKTVGWAWGEADSWWPTLQSWAPDMEHVYEIARGIFAHKRKG